MSALSPFPTALPADVRLSEWRAPDGWRHRRFDWPAAGERGRVLVQGGRADVIEKYLGVAAHLHGRGWSVTSFDWRGQGGSGRLAEDPSVERFADQATDLAAFWREWAVGAGPHVLLAHSMGAHFALLAMLAGEVRPAAVVLSAPMVAVRSPVGRQLGGWLARAMAARGDRSRAAWRWTDSPAERARRFARLTVARGPEQDGRWWQEADPALRLGPPSWGWIAEAFRSGAALARDRRLAALDVPTLFLIADRDRLVDARAARQVAARMPRTEVVRFGAEAGHEVLREGAVVRARAFAAIDAFLDREVP